MPDGRRFLLPSTIRVRFRSEIAFRRLFSGDFVQVWNGLRKAARRFSL